MKNVFILQNHPSSFKLNIEKIANPERYHLYLISNPVGIKSVLDKNYQNYFKKIISLNFIYFDAVVSVIDKIMQQSCFPIEIVAHSEHAVSLCGNLRVYYGLESKNYDRFVNKLLMKEMLRDSDIVLPEYQLFDKKRYKNKTEKYLREIMEFVDFPLFVKPINQAGCLGGRKILNERDFYGWAESALQSPFDYEVDEFIQGDLYHCDSFIKNGKILYTQVSKYTVPCFEWMLGAGYASVTLAENDPRISLFSDYAEEALEVLGLPSNGVTHMEIFQAQDARLYFLEVAYRAPGALIPRQYEKYLNTDIAVDHILLQIDEDYSPSFHRGPYAAGFKFPWIQGKFYPIQQKIPVVSDYELFLNSKREDIDSFPKTVRDFPASALLWNFSYSQLIEDVEKITHHPLIYQERP